MAKTKDKEGFDMNSKEGRLAASAAITKGAQACPDCGNKPHGLEQPFVLDGEVQTRYEIGCLACPPTLKDGKRHTHKVKGFTAKDAVTNWNEGKFIVDNKTDRV